MMPEATGARAFREIVTGGVVLERQTRPVGAATDGRSAKRQRASLTLARMVAVKPDGRPSPGHGGPREGGAHGGVGAIAAVGTYIPWPQCGQRAHSVRSILRMNAATDSTTTGSGAGTKSAARACASFTAFPAGPRIP